MVAGSVLTFVLYLFVVHRWDASRAAYVFVVIGLTGTPLILLGVYLGALRKPRADE